MSAGSLRQEPGTLPRAHCVRVLALQQRHRGGPHRRRHRSDAVGRRLLEGRRPAGLVANGIPAERHEPAAHSGRISTPRIRRSGRDVHVQADGPVRPSALRPRRRRQRKFQQDVPEAGIPIRRRRARLGRFRQALSSTSPFGTVPYLLLTEYTMHF